MEYVANGGCIGCEPCEETGSEVFSMTDEGVAKAVETEVPVVFEAVAAEAKAGCPVGASNRRSLRTERMT